MSDFPDFTAYGYCIERELGHNRSNGRVTYLAINQETQEYIVIKQFQFALPGSTWSAYQHYEQEIKLLKRLKYLSIPRYIDSFETSTGFCLVQEYKEATSLAQRRLWTIVEIRQIAEEVLKVLVYLQQQKPPIIHRDIKPENILVDRKNSIKVYLVDFGFARLGGGEVAASSVVKGTMGFMPPEQLFNRELTDASDLYSLGMTLMCLLTGTRSADVGQLIDEKYNTDFQKLPKQGRPLADWLAKMVAPKVTNRFFNASTALQALRQVDLARPSRTWTASSVAFPWLSSTIHPIQIILALALVTTTSIIGWKLLGQRATNQASGNQQMTPEQTEYNRLLSQANRFVVGNQHALALDIYDKAIQMNPKRTDAWYHKGVVLGFLRRPNEALTCFETALKPEMEWGNVPADEVWAWKARALAFMGRFNEAIAAYDRALSINPNSSEVLKERQVFEGLLRQKGSPRQ